MAVARSARGVPARGDARGRARARVARGRPGAGPAAKTHPRRTCAARPRRPRVYTVRAGDTLATIAAETGVPVARLEKLNPQVEPTSLFIGDRIRLR